VNIGQFNKVLNVMQEPRKTPKRKAEHVFTITVTAAKVLGWSMFCLGITVLMASMAYTSSSSAFIGLGLIFWGAIITYIQTEDYVKETLLDATVLPPLEMLGQIIIELKYKGTAVYLPPDYLKGSETKIYIPKQKNLVIPTAQEIQNRKDYLFVDKPKGILITPPGIRLVHLLEEELKKDLANVGMQHVQEQLMKLLTKDLEIAQNFEFEVEDNEVHVGIKSSAFRALFKEITDLSSLRFSLGCPISSAIACVLARATGKPVIMRNWQTSDNSKKLQIDYLILKE
jgi:hypothetical protein